MSRILKVNQSDYRVQVRSGGNITLDTGVAAGEVRVTGNLVVSGNYTTINVSDMQIEDNIIILNKGETGYGVTEGTSGIQISRGGHPAQPDAQLVFDENVSFYDPITESELPGTWVFKNTENQLIGISVRSITSDGNNDIAIDMQNSVLTVFKLANVDADAYSDLLLALDPTGYHDNDIPTKRYITRYMQSGVFTPGMADVDKIYKRDDITPFTERSRVQAFSTSIDFLINSGLSARLDSTGLQVNHINIFNDTISNTSATQLKLSSSINLVEVDAVLSLTNQSTTITATTLKNKLYSKATDGPGRTGLYFTNTNQYNGANSSDELVSKNRAVLLSMLF